MAEEKTVEQDEVKKAKNKAPNTKTVPITIILAAAFISCVVSIYQGASFETFTMRLLVTVVVFMVLGVIIKMVLDYAFKTMEEITPIDEDISLEDIPDSQEDIDALESEES